MKKRFNSKELTNEGYDYNRRNNDILQDFIDEGYSRKDVICAINFCAEVEIDNGDDVILFLAGMDYQKNKQKKVRKK